MIKVCAIYYILNIYENDIIKHTAILNLNMLKRMLIWKLGMYLSARRLALCEPGLGFKLQQFQKIKIKIILVSMPYSRLSMLTTREFNLEFTLSFRSQY